MSPADRVCLKYDDTTFANLRRPDTAFKTKKEMVDHMLRQGGPPPQNRDEAKNDVHCNNGVIQIVNSHSTVLKALIRDGFRCVVSKRYDTNGVIKNDELMEEFHNGRRPICASKCGYIIPASVGMDLWGLDENDYKVHC